MAGAARLAKKARGIANRMRDRRPLMAAVSRDMLIETEQRFRRQQGPDGRRWKPRKRPAPHPILIKSGRLLGSQRPFSTATQAGVEARAAYSSFHQHGTSRIPARPYLGINRKQSVRYLRAASRYVLKGQVRVR